MPPTPHPPPHHHPHSHSHSPHRPIDPKIWRTCAGNSVQIPILHSRVYYFPQGHLEQYSSSTDETDKVVSFAKILTPSDANNGGGFSVPRFCADSIFPALNYQLGTQS
ncbi:hypothetical protein CerSpe_181250 [Prunus speciosa]